MTEEQEPDIIVSYERDGDNGHFFTMDESGAPVFHVNNPELTPWQRRHWANRLVNAAVLSCIVTTLASELKQRGATIKSMTGRVTSEKEKDAYRRTKVSHLDAEIDVDIGDADPKIFEECKEVINRDTFTMYSFREGIDTDATINRVGG